MITAATDFSSESTHDEFRLSVGHQISCADGILDCIGETPLIRFRRYLDDQGVDLLVKWEAFNPGGSAKDRPALQMLRGALSDGFIGEDSTIIESSSGNMGIGLAQACQYYGLRFICVVDRHAQTQNIAIMRALGAEIICVDQPVEGSLLAARLQRVRQLCDSIPNSFWPNQYANRQNPEAHQRGTIREIDRATGGDFDCLFVATSSTGTAQGCRDYLRKHHRRAQVIAVDAHGSVLFGGSSGERFIPGLGAGQEPALARGETFDLVTRVSDIDCVVGCRRAAQREAVLVGGSAGGVLEVVRSLQTSLRGKRCIAILHDSGTRYLDTVFHDPWVESVLGAPAAAIQSYMSAPALSHSKQSRNEDSSSHD